MVHFFIFAGMENIICYYQDTILAYTQKADRLKRKIHLLGSIRLLLVAGMVGMIWLLKAQEWQILAATVIGFMLPFIGLMVWHTKLSAQKSYAETLVQLCQNELNGINYNYSAFDGAPEKSTGEHAFSLDLDLFGDRSLFQSINRTVTRMGKELLTSWFLHPLTDKEAILARQEAVRELETFTQLRQHFYVTGILQPAGDQDSRLMAALNMTAPHFKSSLLWKVLVWLIPGIWCLIIIGSVLDLVPSKMFELYLPFAFLISYFRAQKVITLHNTVNKMEKILHAYSDLMKSIEGVQFKSGKLAEISKQFVNDGKTASRHIRQLSTYIGALDQRFSLIGVILNILTLRDTRTAMKLEQWKEDHAADTARWFEALAEFDAFCSLGGFAFNHPEYVYPTIADHYFKMEGKALGHPLLRRDVCVKNDIRIEKSPWFLIITGANMAGKSTYLRTVGVNFLLGCIGTPVCAESLTIYPAKLVTSLRTSDSLASNESYFFAELKRLKMIIDRLQQGEKLFIILDEILKGTNSIDKQKGSLALMKQLVANQACGIIATHDLALGELEQEFPEQIKNYRFEADITNDELTFSYLLREGVAQNMNACFLMKKMGITM